MQATLAFESHIVQKPHGRACGAACTNYVGSSKLVLKAATHSMATLFIMATVVLGIPMFGRENQVRPIRQLAMNPRNMSTPHMPGRSSEPINVVAQTHSTGNLSFKPVHMSSQHMPDMVSGPSNFTGQRQSVRNFSSVFISIYNVSAVASEFASASRKSGNPGIYTMHVCNFVRVRLRWEFRPLGSTSSPVLSPWVSPGRCYRFQRAQLAHQWSDEETIRCYYWRSGESAKYPCPGGNLDYRRNAFRIASYQCGAPPTCYGPRFF